MLAFQVSSLRAQFPFFSKSPCVYLDNASTTHKPKSVIQTLAHFYEAENANIHRGIYPLSEAASSRYEGVRKLIASYLGRTEAKDARVIVDSRVIVDAREIVFVKGTTEGINLIAQSYGRPHLRAGDEIILSVLEHHSNIIPWQMLAIEKGLHLKVIPLRENRELDLEAYAELLNPKTKIVAISHVSNVLGSIQPIQTISAMAKAYGALVVVDGAQALPHLRVNVQSLGCDFYVFSGHKAFGPTGVGVIWGKGAIWDTLLPYQGGGNMVHKVSFEKTTYKPYPECFEAGTPPIASVLGLGAAMDFLQSLDFEALHAYEKRLTAYAKAQMQAIPGLKLLESPPDAVGIVCFTIEGVHPHDIAQVLAQSQVAIRAGHHCAQPLLQALGVPALSRVSLACYNTQEDIDALMEGLYRVHRLLA